MDNYRFPRGDSRVPKLSVAVSAEILKYVEGQDAVRKDFGFRTNIPLTQIRCASRVMVCRHRGIIGGKSSVPSERVGEEMQVNDVIH
jgi:hypothetical protein